MTYACRNILFKDSEFFRNLFIDKKSHYVLDLKSLGITFEVLQDVVQAVSRSYVSEDTIKPFMTALDYFKLKNVQRILANSIRAGDLKFVVGSFNILDVWLLSRGQSPLSCVTLAVEYQMKVLLGADVMFDLSFPKLDYQSLFHLLTLLTLSSKEIHRAVKLWMNHDPINRKRDYKLLRLHFSCLPLDIFDNIVPDTDNVLQRWYYHYVIGTENMKLQEFICEHFTDLIFEQSFLGLGFKPLLYMLNLDTLKLTSEKQVFYALKLWINHNRGHDMKKYTQLLYCVRLDPQITVRFLRYICRVN